MLVPGANMTGLAKRLEQKGFIVRQPDPKDERVTLLKITPKGKQTLARIKTGKDAVIERILQDFTHEDKTVLLEKVKQLINATAGANENIS
jgi:DNA-binding MarR family transcriptional regulator